MLQRFAFLVLGVVLSSGVLWAAQNPKKPLNNKQDEKRENEAVKEAQHEVESVQKTIRQREQEVRERVAQLRTAQQATKSAGSALQKVEDRLEAAHAESTGLTAARATLKAAQTELEAKSRPVLERLKETPEYRAAQQAMERAKAAIKPDPDHPDADRKTAVADHAKAAEKVRQLEQAALEKVAELKPLMASVESGESAVRTAKKKFDRAVERDPEMLSAKQAVDKAKQDEGKAETAVADAQRKIADAKAKLTQAQQKLQQKIAQDLKDPNRNKNNKKPK